MTMPQLETLTELKLTDQIKDLINNSYLRGFPVIVAYVDGDRPNLSFRGSAVAFSDDEVAVWARSPEGGIVKGVPRNPNVTMVYREGDPPPARSRANITMRGQARVEQDENARRWVYDNMPQVERDADRDYKGVAVIVKLDSVTGLVPGYRLQMTRG
jgi:hypothetical protein